MIFLLPFLLSLSAHSQTTVNMFNDQVQVQVKELRTLLTGNDCKVLTEETLALQIWSKKNDVKIMSDCVCEDEKCEIDVSEQLPEIYNQTRGICHGNSGPNCWNAALVSEGVLPNLRFTSQKEMSFWMRSPLCRQLKANEEKLPGDIVAIKQKDIGHIHGFVYLTENLAFSKNGPSAYQSPVYAYSLQSPEFIFQLEGYKTKAECRNVYGTPNEKLNCIRWTNSFRCISMDQFLSKHAFSNDLQKNTWMQLSELEAKTAEMTASVLFDTETSLALESSLVKIKKLSALKMNKVTESQEKFIWKAMYLKSSSSIKQVRGLRWE